MALVDLKQLFKEFGVDSLDALTKKRTTDKAIKTTVGNIRRVSMTSEACRAACDAIGLEYQPGYENRVIERTTTDETPDRYGDIVRAAGCDNANYRKNPVVLFAHDHNNFPIGNSLKEWQVKNKWMSHDLHFGNEVDPTGRSETAFRFIASGAMKGGSIGFVPKTSKSDHSAQEQELMGLGKYGVEYLSWEKLEHSGCSVPANPEALANQLKHLTDKSITKEDIDRAENMKLLDAELLDVFWRVLFKGGSGSGHHGHAGRPGEQGGSVGGPGAAFNAATKESEAQTANAKEVSSDAHDASTAAVRDKTREGHEAAAKAHQEAATAHMNAATAARDAGKDDDIPDKHMDASIAHEDAAELHSLAALDPKNSGLADEAHASSAAAYREAYRAAKANPKSSEESDKKSIETEIAELKAEIESLKVKQAAPLLPALPAEEDDIGIALHKAIDGIFK